MKNQEDYKSPVTLRRCDIAYQWSGAHSGHPLSYVDITEADGDLGPTFINWQPSECFLVIRRRKALLLAGILASDWRFTPFSELTTDRFSTMVNLVCEYTRMHRPPHLYWTATPEAAIWDNLILEGELRAGGAGCRKWRDSLSPLRINQISMTIHRCFKDFV